MESLYSPELERKIDSVFDVFDKTIMTKSRVTLAYSRGKDSTVLAKKRQERESKEVQ